MNIEKKVIQIVSEVTGIPEGDINSDKFLAKDLSISETELRDILTEMSHQLNLPLPEDLKDFKTIQDLLLFVQDNQLLP